MFSTCEPQYSYRHYFYNKGVCIRRITLSFLPYLRNMLDVGFLLLFYISDILRGYYRKRPAAWNGLIELRLRHHGQKAMAQNWTLEPHIH